MRQVSQQILAERYLRLREVIRILDFGTGTKAFDKVQELAASQIKEDGTPLDQSLELILKSPHDYLNRVIRTGNRHARPLVELLCEIFAERDTRLTMTVEQKKERYFQYIQNNVPLEGSDLRDAGIREVPVGPLVPTFPFFHLSLGEIAPADGDQFFNAIPQGPGAASRDWIVERHQQWACLRESLRTAAPGAWDVHFIGGASGSGKTTLLDLIAWEALNLGTTVFRCEAEYADPNSFYDRLNLALATAGERVLVLVDDAHRLEARNVLLDPLTRMRPSGANQSVTLVMAANWHVMRNRLPMDLQPEARSRKFHVLSVLGEQEIDALLAKICEAERTGDIKEIRCTLSQAERRTQISDERDRLVLLALFKLRYAKNIRDALRDEFRSIAAEPARQLYTRVAVMELLECPLPRSSLANLRAGAFEAMPWLKGVVRVDAGALRLGHPLLVRPTVDVVSSDIDLRPDLLCSILVDLNSQGLTGQQALLQFVLGEGTPKRLWSFFRYDAERLRGYIETLADHIEAFKATGLAAYIHGHLGALEKDLLFDPGHATYRFEDALEFDPENSFAAKQLAWSWLRLGDYEQAETAAREAIGNHPDDAGLLSDCAFIASWCSGEGFSLATGIYADLLQKSPDDEELRRRWIRHTEAEEIGQKVKGAFSDTEYQLMKAPSFIWRVRRGAVRQYKNALFGRLAGALRESTFNPELLTEATSAKVVQGDVRLTALLNANLARHLYERWYHEDESVDLDVVEAHFKTAIRLWPEEPFAHCWYGTFLKEARDDFNAAELEYLQARTQAKAARNPDFVDHPMILNNLALLLMAKVYKQRASANQALPRAAAYLNKALQRMDDTASKFTWPVDTQGRLQAMATEFGVELPAT